MTKKKKYVGKKNKAQQKQIVNNEKTQIVCVLDSSYSMGDTIDEARSGFNEYLKKQKALGGRASVTVAIFDDALNYQLLYNDVPISKAREVTAEDWYPKGMTALYDAIGRTASTVKQINAKMLKKDRPDKVLFIIVTDGGENDSKEYKGVESISTLIEEMETEHNWKFVYLGADPREKAIDAGTNIGIAAGNTLSFMNTSSGTGAMYATLSNATSNYRGMNTITTNGISSVNFSSGGDTLMADVTGGSGEVGEEEIEEE